MDAPIKPTTMMEAVPAKTAEPTDNAQQPTRVEPMSVDASMRGGDEGEEICCAACAGLCCFECCKCCC